MSLTSKCQNKFVQTNVWIYLYRKIDTNECPNKYLCPIYLNIRIYSSHSVSVTRLLEQLLIYCLEVYLQAYLYTCSKYTWIFPTLSKVGMGGSWSGGLARTTKLRLEQISELKWSKYAIKGEQICSKKLGNKLFVSNCLMPAFKLWTFQLYLV